MAHGGMCNRTAFSCAVPVILGRPTRSPGDLLMKPLILMLAALLIGGQLSSRLHAADENKSRDRLIAKDSNKDGKLSREELGEQLWKRVSGQDANGDGVLDEAE